MVSSFDWFPLRFSLQVSFVATSIAVLMGVSLAWVLARCQFRGKEWLDAAISLPLVLPPTVLGYYLLVMLGQRSWVGRTIESILGFPLAFTPLAAVLAATIHALPLMVKSVRVAFVEVDRSLENVARTLGAGELRVFWTITVPLAMRGIWAATALAFARAMGDFGVTIMIAGNIPGRTQTASVAIYDAVQAGRDTDALFLVGIVSVLAILVLYVINIQAYRR
jgi:molybdate transport system permease protein